MNSQKPKTLITNIVTGVIVIGILVVGYFVFVNNSTPAVNGNSPQKTVTTTDIGSSVSRGVSELSDLNRAVASGAGVFSTPLFRGLEDFSTVVPEEPVGRENPFIATPWKIKIKALEDTAGKKSAK